MKPFWRSKKLWSALVSLIALVVAEATGRDDLIVPITVIASALLGGFGLADFGKERAAIVVAGAQDMKSATNADVDTSKNNEK